jgi:hypothetical protein
MVEADATRTDVEQTWTCAARTDAVRRMQTTSTNVDACGTGGTRTLATYDVTWEDPTGSMQRPGSTARLSGKRDCGADVDTASTTWAGTNVISAP